MKVPALKLPRRHNGPGGFLLALLLHALLILVVLAPWLRDLSHFQRAIGASGNTGGGGGGGSGYRDIALPAFQRPAAAPAAPVPEPQAVALETPTVMEPFVEPVVAPADSLPAVASTAGASGAGVGPGSAGGSGGGSGGGTGTGTGPGTGPGSGGEGGLARPPQIRHLVLSPEGAPKAMQGRATRVTFYVNAAGVVQQIEVVPAIEDRAYARKFEERMRSYRFRPARDGQGTSVPGTVTIVTDLPMR
ncbi:MAG: hypothetical protein ACREMH_10865 [Gemmatimonadales bacterium]